jgi:ribosomal protein S18 acetylase RimI-like enzyme
MRPRGTPPPRSLRQVDVAIRRAGAEVLDRLRPLWLELHHHHQAVGGAALGPYVGDDVSWAARRELYGAFFAGGGFAVLAERGDELIGYALVALKTSAETELDDTWVSAPRVAEIETLSVLPAARGAGVGTALLDAVDAELAAEGIGDVLIAAMAGNVDAIRLYERRGFRPASLFMVRLAGRT